MVGVDKKAYVKRRDAVLTLSFTRLKERRQKLGVDSNESYGYCCTC